MLPPPGPPSNQGAPGEFRGAPDLLAPEYLVEIELRDPRHERKNRPIPPRQVLRLPAWR